MKKEEQKQHLIDMMRYDENLGLYKETEQMNVGAVRRSFSCLKCKEEVIYLDEDLDIMERAENNDGVFCSSECEYSFYNGGDGCDY